MKRILLLLAIFALATVPVSADWDIKLAVSPGYIAQEVEDEAGEKQTDFNPVISTGIEFFRVPKVGSIGWGFSINAATVVDEGQENPSIIPCGMLHIGASNAQAYVGGCWDSQNGGSNEAVATLGFTAAF